MNRLDVLPRGFGAFPVLEVLDLTYNNLNEKQLPGNFFMMGKRKEVFPTLLNLYKIILLVNDVFLFVIASETLRALYLADNDFEYLPPEIGHLKNLQIVRNIVHLTPLPPRPARARSVTKTVIHVFHESQPFIVI